MRLRDIVHTDNCSHIFDYTYSIAPRGYHTWESGCVDIAGAIECAKELSENWITDNEDYTIGIFHGEELIAEIDLQFNYVVE